MTLTHTNRNENDEESNEELILAWRSKCRELGVAPAQGFVSITKNFLMFYMRTFDYKLFDAPFHTNNEISLSYLLS